MNLAELYRLLERHLFADDAFDLLAIDAKEKEAISLGALEALEKKEANLPDDRDSLVLLVSTSKDPAIRRKAWAKLTRG